MGSIWGTLFRVTTFGESHGAAVGVVVEGFPPGLRINEAGIQEQLLRRRPGQSSLTSPRREPDRLRILSGVYRGRTLGTPIALVLENKNADSSAYRELTHVYRPSHADYTYAAKYGIRDPRGGGRASARETAARVAAGALAEQFLLDRWGVEIVAWVESVGNVGSRVVSQSVDRPAVDRTPVRCPDLEAAREMEALITGVRKEKDSLGGVVAAVARGVPPGWGDPVFDKLEADLGHALLSIPAAKGFEVGSGFRGTRMRGSEHNDPFFMKQGRVCTRTNYSGGIQGGISNGEPILVRVAFKPVASIFLPQQTIDDEGKEVELLLRGRHDPCVVPRAVPVVEAAMALVLADHALRHFAQCGI